MKKVLVIIIVFASVSWKTVNSQVSLTSIDSIIVNHLVGKISELVRDTSLAIIKRSNGYNIELSQENSLKIEFLKPEKGSVVIISKVDSFEIKGHGNFLFDMSYILLGNQTMSFNTTGSGEIFDLKNKKVKLSDGKVSSQIQFSINNKLVNFSSCLISYYDKKNPGIFSEGTIFEWDGKKYIFSNGKWKKLT